MRATFQWQSKVLVAFPFIFVHWQLLDECSYNLCSKHMHMYYVQMVYQTFYLRTMLLLYLFHLTTFLMPPSKTTAYQPDGNLHIPNHKKVERVLERIINNKLIDFLLECELITRHKHGFIRKRTTNTYSSSSYLLTNLSECMIGL